MTTIKKIIYEVDKEIKIKRHYLNKKKHRNGIFDFQYTQEKVEPYQIDYSKYIYPFINSLLGERQYNEIADVYSLGTAANHRLYQDYFNHGILARTVLLDNTGLLVATNYYKNVAPENYAYKIELPEDPELKLKTLHNIAFRGADLDESMAINSNIHFNEELRMLLKELNPGIKFSKNSKFQLEKQNNDITWKDIKFAIESVINKLDDTCVNIFNRVDYINFLSNNVTEIKFAINDMSDQDRAEFKKFYEEKKEWFSLIVDGIDLTQNNTYKQYVNPESIKEQAKRIGEVMQYLTLYLITDHSAKTVVKKKKI